MVVWNSALPTLRRGHPRQARPSSIEVCASGGGTSGGVVVVCARAVCSPPSTAQINMEAHATLEFISPFGTRSLSLRHSGSTVRGANDLPAREDRDRGRERGNPTVFRLRRRVATRAATTDCRGSPHIPLMRATLQGRAAAGGAGSTPPRVAGGSTQ